MNLITTFDGEFNQQKLRHPFGNAKRRKITAVWCNTWLNMIVLAAPSMARQEKKDNNYTLLNHSTNTILFFGDNMKNYDVVLSFAGEQRKYAENLAKIIRHNGYKVFYDDFEQAEVWGQELNKYLKKIYEDSSPFCIMFTSEQYKNKPYPYRERLAAINKFYSNLGSEYILPVKIDDTIIEELPSSIAHLDLRRLSIIKIGEIFLKKIGCENFILPDSLDFKYLTLNPKETNNLSLYIKDIASNSESTAHCPSCKAAFDISTIPQVNNILCPNCRCNFNPQYEINEIISRKINERNIGEHTQAIILTIKLDCRTFTADNVTCCYCRRSFHMSDEDMEEKKKGVYVLIYNRTYSKQTFIFFCHKCKDMDLQTDININSMNMFPGFTLR